MHPLQGPCVSSPPSRPLSSAVALLSLPPDEVIAKTDHRGANSRPVDNTDDLKRLVSLPNYAPIFNSTIPGGAFLPFFISV